jgi:hypothetical protein
MIKITALICFLAVGNYGQDLCFYNAEIPVQFPTLEKCQEFGNGVVAYMNEDLINRNIKMTLQCVQTGKFQGV